jgi:prophage regulatory protein
MNTKGNFKPFEKTGYVRERQLIEQLVPFSQSTLRRKIKAGEFPAPIRLSAGIVAWRRSDVEAWIKAREAEGVQR